MKKLIPTALATLSLLFTGLPVLTSATPANAAVTTIPNLPARWKSISSPGSGTTCALATTGTIWCWGKAEGRRGVIWDATKGDPASGTAVGPMQVGTASNWVAVEVSATHACAKNDLLELWCWGGNANGQLGNGTTTDSQVPVKVKSNNKPWYSFSLTNAGTCGVQTTGLWCWGDNTNNWLLPDSSGDSTISLPRFYTSTFDITAISEVQIGAVSAIRNGGKVYINTASGYNELAAPSNSSWVNMSVRPVGSSAPTSPFFNATFDTAICLINSQGKGYCYSRHDLTNPIVLGSYTDWSFINIRQDNPRGPICGLRSVSAVPTVSCFSIYGLNPTKHVWTGFEAGRYGCASDLVTNPNFTNAVFRPVRANNCGSYGGSSTDIKLWAGTVSETQSIDFSLPSSSAIANLNGGFYTGSVTGQTDYNAWGRLYALTSDGQIYVMGDGKYGERQDGISNSAVTDTWAPALVQAPSVTSVSKSSIPKTGGSTITASGSFLVGVTAVSVGGVAVSSWTESASGTTLQFSSPNSSAGGTVDLTVTTNAGPATLSNAFTYGDAPSAPTISGISPIDSGVTVGWSAPFNAGSGAVTGYLVTVSPGGATCLWSAGPLSCTVTGLTNGTTYRANVKAINAVGAGVASANSSSFVPYKAPSGPSIVSVSPGDGQITITWSPATNNGSAITRYDAVAQPGGNSCSTSGTGTSCTISPLTNGTSYSISVYASNDAGDGEVSTFPSTVVPRTLAGAPTNVSASPGDRQISVSWRAPSSNGGSAVTSYTVTAQPGSVTCTAVAPSTSCNLLGLSNGSVYSITVVATNPAGDSVASSSITSSPVTIPGKPTISATEPGSNSVLVRWRAPSATGGAIVTSYTVVASPGGNSCSTTGAVLFCTVTGLDNGTLYAFTVTATNSAGTGTASASYNGVPATVPNSPRSISATPTNQGLVVAWAAPNYDGGSPITGYVATVRSTGDTCTTGSTTLSCTFGNLANGTTYIVDVIARNNSGDSASASSNNVTPRTVPSKPLSVSLTPGQGTIRVSWVAPQSDGGSAITSYVASASPGVGISCTTTGTYCDLLNLTAGTSYSVTVVATNAAGTGSASSVATAIPFDRPGAPTSVSASAEDMSINVSWSAPTNNGGSPITGYIAMANGNESLKCVTPSEATGCSIRGLTNGSKYTIRVTAVNAAGSGADAIVAGQFIPRGVSIAPTNVTVEAQDKSLIVKWRAVTQIVDTNGSPIIRYIATAQPSGLKCEVDGKTGNNDNTTCTITGLQNGSQQTVTVVARNDAGLSPSSLAVTKTPRSTPGAPFTVNVEALDGALSISWTPPIDIGGVPILRYIVAVVPDGTNGTSIPCPTSLSGDSRNCLVTGLTNGKAYSVTVQAVNDVGAGPVATSSLITPAAVPSTPTRVWPQVGNGQITVRWTKSEDNGSPVTSYHVNLEPGGYGCDVTDLSFLGCTISGLDNGVAYSISVYATNGAGDSLPGQVEGTATPRAIPGAVQSVVVNPSVGKATVSWVPGFNGGSPIQSYNVIASPGGVLRQAKGTDTQVEFTNLVNGTQYTFSIVAVNEAGSSAPTITQKTLIAGTANAPVALKVKAGDRSMVVTFAPPAINGGTPITNYTVFANDEVVCTVAPAKTLTCTVNGLSNGDPYEVYVVANNLVGSSVPSNSVLARPGKISDPVNNVEISAGVASVTVSWSEPNYDGDSPITGYVVTLTPSGKTCKTDADTTSCDISGLTIGTTYVAKVVAVNGVGASQASTSPAVKVVGPPTAVRNLSATAMVKGAKLYFAPPASNGGSSITNYYFTVTGPNNFLWESGPIAAGSVRSGYSITGLTKNVSYSISVVVENDFGMSVAATTTVKSK